MKIRFADLGEMKKYLEDNGIFEVCIATKYDVEPTNMGIDFAKFYILVTALDKKQNRVLYYKEFVGTCIRYDEEEFKKLGEKGLEREREIPFWNKK